MPARRWSTDPGAGSRSPESRCRRGYAAGTGFRGEAGRTSYDAVLCVGNSLAHAVRTQMAGAPRSKVWHSCWATGGVLALTSRNWEQIGSGRQPARRVGPASWSAPPARQWWCTPGRCRLPWEPEHRLQISVAALPTDGDRLQVTTELLSIWPFPSRGTPSQMVGRRGEPRRVHVRRDPTGVSHHRSATRRATSLTHILVIRGRMTRCAAEAP